MLFYLACKNTFFCLIHSLAQKNNSPKAMRFDNVIIFYASICPFACSESRFYL
jgi:hypothetical protein